MALYEVRQSLEWRIWIGCQWQNNKQPQKKGIAMKTISAGQWFITHYRARQRDSGTLAVARQLRKQGVPLEVALAILAPPN